MLISGRGNELYDYNKIWHPGLHFYTGQWTPIFAHTVVWFETNVSCISCQKLLPVRCHLMPAGEKVSGQSSVMHYGYFQVSFFDGPAALSLCFVRKSQTVTMLCCTFLPGYASINSLVLPLSTLLPDHWSWVVCRVVKSSSISDQHLKCVLSDWFCWLLGVFLVFFFYRTFYLLSFDIINNSDDNDLLLWLKVNKHRTTWKEFGFISK